MDMDPIPITYNFGRSRILNVIGIKSATNVIDKS